MIQHYTVADEPSPLAFFKKNGYYTVGDKIFNHKINALEEATHRSLPVEWEFNTDVYKAISWRNPIELSIQQLYKIRAQQLRDRYDYLVLAYSGGADSTTVLKSFLDNNIHLDEIMVDWPLSQTDGKFQVSTDSRPENYISEWDLAIKPMLEYVSKNYPRVKITVTDSIEQLTLEDYEDTCTITQIHNYVSIKRYRKVSNRLRELNDTFDRVALVLGIEKPVLYIEKNILCVRFCDAHCWYKSSFDQFERNIEYFYWTPDLPEIVVKQAQILYHYIKLNPTVIDLIVSDKNPGPNKKHQLLNALVKSLVYPSWDNNTFQADKGNSFIYNEQYSWFFNKEKTIEIQSWESSMHSRLNIIDPAYLKFFEDGKFYGYTRHYSRLYPIGAL